VIKITGVFMTKIELDKVLELHKKYLNGEKDGICANLFKADLTNADLSYANLFKANLTDADLHNADQSNANLSYANLTNTNLFYANLTDADLSRANLSGANLTYANLSGADLTHADLFKAGLFYANLTNANLSGADLTHADLTNTKGVLSFTLGKHFGYVWLNKDKEQIVRIGCLEHTMKHWKNNIEKIGKDNNYTDLEIKLYSNMLKFIRLNSKTK
jgi:hypothetical protein